MSDPTRDPSPHPQGGSEHAVTDAALDAQIDIASASILLVDDHEQNLELLQAYLEDIGCRVRTAREGVEAMQEVKRDQPDLVDGQAGQRRDLGARLRLLVQRHWPGWHRGDDSARCAIADAAAVALT